MVARLGPRLFGEAKAHRNLGFQIFGRGHVWHFGIDVMQPFLLALEAGGEVKDRAALLAGHDPAIGKAAAIEIARDLVFDPEIFAAAAQEIGVERMRRAIRIDGIFSCQKRLRDHLSAKHAAYSAALFAAFIAIFTQGFGLKQFDQPADQAFGGGLAFHRRGFALQIRTRQ